MRVSRIRGHSMLLSVPRCTVFPCFFHHRSPLLMVTNTFLQSLSRFNDNLSPTGLSRPPNQASFSHSIMMPTVHDGTYTSKCFCHVANAPLIHFHPRRRHPVSSNCDACQLRPTRAPTWRRRRSMDAMMAPCLSDQFLVCRRMAILTAGHSDSEHRTPRPPLRRHHLVATSIGVCRRRMHRKPHSHRLPHRHGPQRMLLLRHPHVALTRRCVDDHLFSQLETRRQNRGLNRSDVSRTFLLPGIMNFALPLMTADFPTKLGRTCSNRNRESSRCLPRMVWSWTTQIMALSSYRNARPRTLRLLGRNGLGLVR